MLFLDIPVSFQCCDKTNEQLKAVLLASDLIIPSLWVVKLIRLFSSTLLYYERMQYIIYRNMSDLYSIKCKAKSFQILDKDLRRACRPVPTNINYE